MSKFSLHIGHETRDYGTMTCDYDNGHFNQRLRFQHSRESGHGHDQKVPCPASNDIEV